MSDFFNTDDPGSPWVPPLTSLKPDGKPYERSATVQAEIGRMMRRPQSHWIAETPDLQNESLVFLIRQARRSEQKLYGRLVQELCKRITRLARPLVAGLDRLAVEEILSKVEIDILELVLADKPSLKSEFLEVAFAQAVERRTIDAIRRHKYSPFGRRGQLRVDLVDEDGNEIERPIEQVADERPGPEDILLDLQDGNRRHQLLRQACDAVEERHHLEAVILHYAHGWPITSNDPKKPDLVRHFAATPGEIMYWIDTALKQMRAALGVNK
jgi:hypothetical protein